MQATDSLIIQSQREESAEPALRFKVYGAPDKMSVCAPSHCSVSVKYFPIFSPGIIDDLNHTLSGFSLCCYI